MGKRYLSFMKRNLSTGRDEGCPFLETHFREAGLSPQKLSGMPLLEAHELVNKWNRDQPTRYPNALYIFWLE